MVKENPGAKLESVRIAGRPVTFLSTPDNRLRSFYASDGNFHLITTSRTIVEWFLATVPTRITNRSAQSEAFQAWPGSTCR